MLLAFPVAAAACSNLLNVNMPGVLIALYCRVSPGD